MKRSGRHRRAQISTSRVPSASSPVERACPRKTSSWIPRWHPSRWLRAARWLRRLRARLLRGHSQIKAELLRRKNQRRREQRFASFRGNNATGRSWRPPLTTLFAPPRYRQRRPAKRSMETSLSYARAWKTCCSIAVLTPLSARTEFVIRRESRYADQQPSRRLAFRHHRRTPSHALVQGINNSSSPTCARSPPEIRQPAAHYRRPAIGRHERGRRPVRLRKDVPPASGEERPRNAQAVAVLLPYLEAQNSRRADAMAQRASR